MPTLKFGKLVHLEVYLAQIKGQAVVCMTDKLKNDDRSYNITYADFKEYEDKLQNANDKAKLNDAVKAIFVERNEMNSLKSLESNAERQIAAAPPPPPAKTLKTKAAIGTHEGALQRKKAALEHMQKVEKDMKQAAKDKKSAAAKKKIVSVKKVPQKPKVAKVQKEEIGEIESEDDEETSDREEEVEVDLIGDMSMATRAPSKNARGHQRVLGKGKRSSAYDEGKDEGEGAKKKKKKVSIAGDEITSNSAVMPILPGAETLFRAQRTGSRGLHEASRKHAQRSAMMPSRDELMHFEKKLYVNDPLAPEREALASSQLSQWSQWLWYIQLNFNLLLFGIGCKAKLVKAFVTQRLHGEDVLSIDGSRQDIAVGSTRVVKALLDTICSAILKQPGIGAACLNLESYVCAVTSALDILYCRDRDGSAAASVVTAPAAKIEARSNLVEVHTEAALGHSDFTWIGHYNELEKTGDVRGSRLARNASLHSASSLGISGEADPSWGGRYAHAQAKLYLIVHSIDGDCLQSIESQRILARLADCASVSIIATSDKVNAPLLWGHEELARFRWTFVHVPTYVDYDLRADFALFAGTKGPGSQGHALEYILASLTNDHRQLVGVLAADALSRLAKKAADTNDISAASSSNLAHRGIPFDELLPITVRKLIANTKERLTTLLKELEDHRLLSLTGDSRRQQFVIMQLPVEQLQRIKDSGI